MKKAPLKLTKLAYALLGYEKDRKKETIKKVVEKTEKIVKEFGYETFERTALFDQLTIHVNADYLAEEFNLDVEDVKKNMPGIIGPDWEDWAKPFSHIHLDRKYYDLSECKDFFAKKWDKCIAREERLKKNK